MEKEKGLEVTEESDWNVNVQHNGRGIKAHEFIWRLLLKGISALNGLKRSRQKNAVRSSHNKGDLQQQLVTKEELKELNLAFSGSSRLPLGCFYIVLRQMAKGSAGLLALCMCPPAQSCLRKVQVPVQVWEAFEDQRVLTTR